MLPLSSYLKCCHKISNTEPLYFYNGLSLRKKRENKYHKPGEVKQKDESTDVV